MSYESMTIATPEASRKHRPAPAAEVSLTDEERREAARRKEIAETAKRASELDRELFGSILAAEAPAEALEKIETVESLTFGKEIDRKDVGEPGINAITRRVYEGDPPRIAYVKPQSGEARFVYHEQRRAVYQLTDVWDDAEQKFITNRKPLPKGEGASLELELKKRAAYKERIAQHYGIPVEEVPLSDTEVTARSSVDVGKGAIREYIASRVNELLRLDVIPMTVLRAEKGNVDLSSVQESVKSSDSENPARPPTDEELAEILKLGSAHPSARSLMRIACLDHLIKATDRHAKNILIDPVTRQTQGIDNGYSMGLSEGATGFPLISVALEAVQDHADWKLDDEALATMFELYESVKEYLREREEDVSKRRFGTGKEIKYLTGLFRLLYGSEQIAKKEALDFMVRLKEIIDLGRPPQMSKSQLWPIMEDLKVAKNVEN